MNPAILLAERIGHPILGILMPAFILAISFWVAWAMFKKFTRE
jgi:hypothetical protein